MRLDQKMISTIANWLYYVFKRRLMVVGMVSQCKSAGLNGGLGGFAVLLQRRVWPTTNFVD